MVKVKGPLQSTRASGTLADAVTFSNWKGRPYVKSRALPANPNTAPQAGMRAMFSGLSSSWDALHPMIQATWADLGIIGNVSPFHAYMQENQKRWAQHKAPCMRFTDQDEDATHMDVNTYTATGQVRSVSCELIVNAVLQGWGWLIHRSPTTAFTPGPHTLVHALLNVNVGRSTWIHAPLEPGTYFYRMFKTTIDGASQDLGDELEAIVSPL